MRLLAVLTVLVLVAAGCGAGDDIAPIASTTAEASVVQLDPAGPYSDGQRVTVSVRVGLAADWSNDPPRLCSTFDGLASCDPAWAGPGYDDLGRDAGRSTASIVVRRATFTPTGWRDCEEVECHLHLQLADGSYESSPRLRFTGEPAAPAVGLSASIVDAGGRFTITPTGLSPDPSWIAHRSEVDLPPFGVQVCTFAELENDCDLFTDAPPIDPDDPDLTASMSMRREIYGFDGWTDCFVATCVVIVRTSRVHGFGPGPSTLGDDIPVAAAPLVFEPTMPVAPRPTIEIVELGEEISVRGDHLPPGDETILLAICHQDPTVRDDCGYSLQDLTGPSFETVFSVGERYRSDACRRGECFLALMPGQDGIGPIATVPLPIPD